MLAWARTMLSGPRRGERRGMSLSHAGAGGGFGVTADFMAPGALVCILSAESPSSRAFMNVIEGLGSGGGNVEDSCCMVAGPSESEFGFEAHSWCWTRF